MSISQHISILPEAAQIAWKLGTSVGTGDAKEKRSQSSFLRSRVDVKIGGDDLRTVQSRSAIPRTSTSQQLGVPEPQSAVA